jgi:Fur family peroxide stress response transcriptional regulator
MVEPKDFRDLCRRRHLAATHQRKIIYETVMSLHGHPSPEVIYDKVKRKIPSISLATVYNNIRTFLESGMLREVSMHHGSLRVEPNGHAHHHLVCVRCKRISDLDAESLGPLKIKVRPRGFRVTRIAVDVLGVCAECATREASR